jgi:hypothetical protein
MIALDHPLYEEPWPDGDYHFFQIGHVVDDLVRAANEWAVVFGIGPFHVLPVVDQQLTMPDGQISTVRIQVAAAQAGPVQIELIQQHCDTPSIYRDWTRGGTSSFHQLATVTDDYDAKKAHFERLGHRTAAESLGSRFRVAYVDTAAAFGFYTEIVERTPAFIHQLDVVSKTCATWDGTDPVRVLTRDGYRVPEAEHQT